MPENDVALGSELFIPWQIDQTVARLGLSCLAERNRV
jgi:hypothetical protein